ncbi:hypothetical protein ACH49M_32290 [Rhodococcus qingshengii]|uniref:Uncharacterized protein n=1 Tax=Rhodococcus baikonurensis TaxID=172041 RepID=A0ABV5XG07_9NOCA|nr:MULTISPECIES: hypothetical protein [Rhodococcus]
MHQTRPLTDPADPSAQWSYLDVWAGTDDLTVADPYFPRPDLHATATGICTFRSEPLYWLPAPARTVTLTAEWPQIGLPASLTTLDLAAVATVVDAPPTLIPRTPISLRHAARRRAARDTGRSAGPPVDAPRRVVPVAVLCAYSSDVLDSGGESLDLLVQQVAEDPGLRDIGVEVVLGRCHPVLSARCVRKPGGCGRAEPGGCGRAEPGGCGRGT